jgi:hypothetical protein
MTDRRDLLDQYLAPRTSTSPSGDPLDGALEADSRNRAARVYFAVRQADADRAARANRLARETGLPSDVVERNLGTVEADAFGRRGAATIIGNSRLSEWFGEPRRAAASKDDLEALGALSTLIGPNSVGDTALGLRPRYVAPVEVRRPADLSTAERAKRIRARELGRRETVEQARPETSGRTWWRGVGIATIGGFQQARIGAKLYLSDMLGLENLVPKFQAEYEQVQDVIRGTTPRDLTSFGQSVYSGLVSTGQAIPALAATLATLPAGGWGGLAVAGGQSGLGAYGKYRTRGGTSDEALLGGVLEGGIEAVTEKIPLGTLVGGFGKKGLGRFIGEFTLKEMGGEQLATLGQDAVDTAIANPNATWSQYLADRPQAAIDTAVAVIIQTGAIGGGSAVVRALRPVERDMEQATDGIAGANIMDAAIAQAEASKLRARDPDAFRQFVEQHTEGGPIEHVYLPAEKLRELMQSDGYEPADWAWAPDLSEQLAQASAAGGDVVLPLAGVAAHLAGTQTWQTIKADVRLTPGGMSEREANDFAEAYSEIMEQQGRVAAAQIEAERSAAAPERRVYDEVLSQARAAGFNLRASQAYAELWAQRYASRAARLGIDAWDAFRRSNVTIRQELPETLAAYRAADNLDLVINAMRRGARTSKPSGPSLLEWIALQGGLSDRGGDVTSMGGDKWHRGRPGRRKLVRRDDAAAGSLERLAPLARDAGFLAASADGTDAAQLLDAIGRELRGTPVYADVSSVASSEAQDATARAADDLRALLDTSGVDPDTATREEIDAVVGAAEETATRALEQGEARGRLELYADGQKIIRLFEGRDLSTLLHETGHLWVEELKEDAERPDAPDDLKAEWQTVREWFAANGHEMEPGGSIPTEAHELWARGMERYFMEGKSPSSALASAFQSFRAWLLRIYQVVQRLNVPLTDDVRDVMARMIATDEAIAAAAEDAEAKALFATADEAGMTDAEFEAYSRTVAQARTDAFDALLYRTMETVRRARTKEWKEQRANVRADVATRIAQRPEFRALAILRARDDTRVALDRTALVEDFGEDAQAMIPKGVPPTVATTGGVHPDILAEQVGFASGRELVTTLIGLQQRENELRAVGDKRSAFNEAVDTEADSIMRERHGDALTDGSIEEEALAAIHNDTRATVIASELGALGRKVGRAPTPWKLAREWAQRTVREGMIGEQTTGAAIARHQRAEAKAGREAEKAMLAGNAEAAFRAKQQQMLSNALFRAAKDAKDDVDRIVKRLGRLASAKSQPSMEQEYLDRIHDLLEAYDMRPRTARELAERESFSAWVAAKEAAGEEVHVPARLRDANTVNFTKLTVDDLMALDDTVASIAHLGRVKKKLVLAQEERDFDEMVEDFLATAEALPERQFTAHRNERRTKLGRAKAFARDFGAMMVKMEFLADDLDNGDPNGVMNRLLVQGSTQTANHQAQLTEDVLAPLAALYNDMPAEQQRRLAERVTVPEFVEINPETMEILPGIYSRSDLLAVALNTGTDSNFDKMVRGESLAFRQMPDLQWSREKVEAVLARELSAEDWQFVQAVWRQIGSLWPEIERAERAITGVVPERVEPRRVQTPFGEIEGAYYPIVYDPARSSRAADNYQDDATKLLGQMGRAVSTPKGHTIERTEYAAPLMLALEPVLFNHVRRVTTRIAYGAWVRDVLKFTNDRRVRAMIDRKLGPEYHAQITHWLRGQVNDAAMDTSSIRALDQVLRKFRVNATLVGLGFRMTTMVAQVGGLPNSANQIGAKWLARGMGEAVASGGAARDFAFARSPELARRAQDFDRDIAAAFRDMEGSSSPFDRVRAWAFWGIGMIDVYLVAMPTWLGGYRRAIEEGMTETDAAAFADKAVRKSQGSGRPKDLAAIQNATEGYRVLTMFYSFFSVLYNQQREMIRDAQKGNYQKAAMTAWWVMIAGPLLSSLLVGDWPQDEESWGAWAIRKVFFGLWAGVPGVRDLANVTERKVSGQFSEFGTAPIYRSFEGLLRIGDDAVRKAEGKNPSQRWLRTAIETPGYFLGLPTGQAAATADYLYAVANDEQQPEDVQDVVAGVAKGRREDQR